MKKCRKYYKTSSGQKYKYKRTPRGYISEKLKTKEKTHGIRNVKGWTKLSSYPNETWINNNSSTTITLWDNPEFWNITIKRHSKDKGRLFDRNFYKLSSAIKFAENWMKKHPSG